MYFQIQIKSKTVGRNTKSPHELAISQRKKNNWKKNIHHSWEIATRYGDFSIIPTPITGFHQILQFYLR